MTPIRFATAAVLLTVGASPTLAAQCSDHATMTRHLAENWGESRQSVALDAADALVELFASPETGTWTLTVTQPGGPTCMIASGHAFETVSETLPVLDEGA